MGLRKTMKNDTQHLDFLMSQYLDNTLDPTNRKLVEQELAHNPIARRSFNEQREVQDLLDDWGNRIPMIDWNAFDQQLCAKLAQQEVTTVRAAKWQAWLRSVAAAASILLAVGIGYAWHAYSQSSLNGAGGLANNPANASQRTVHMEDEPLAGPNMRVVQFNDVPPRSAPNAGGGVGSNLTLDQHEAVANTGNGKTPAKDATALNSIPGSVRVQSDTPMTTQPALDTLR